jgi:hypothetical protein
MRRLATSACAGTLAILAACRPGAEGASSSSSNDTSPPELAAGTEAGAEPLLGFTSRTVDLEPPFGGRDSREVGVVGRWATAARLAVQTLDPAGLEVEVLPAQDGGAQSVRVTARGAHVGRFAGQVVFATGLSRPETLTLLYSWKVPSNLRVEPTNPVIDLRASGSTGTVIHMSSGRGDFRLQAAQVVEGPFEASVSPVAEGGSYSISVRVARDRMSANQRGVLGTLRLLSNDPAEPRTDVPLFALGAP